MKQHDPLTTVQTENVLPSTDHSTAKVLKGIVLILFMLSLLLSVWLGYLYKEAKDNSEVDVLTREGVVTQIQDLSQLQTVAYRIDTVITTQKQGNWYALWQDEQKGLFVAHGKVLAGVDLNKLRPDDVVITSRNINAENRVDRVPSDADLNIHITLPRAEIFEVFLDNIEVYDVQTGLFNLMQPDSEMLHQAQTAGKAQVLSQACEGDILDMASNNAKKQIAGLFEMTGATVQIEISSHHLPTQAGC